MEAPELTVIVPCLDEQANLRELARRVLFTFEAGEIIGELLLVDDGSRDGSAAVFAELQTAHPERVRVLRHTENRGIAAAWLTGVANARGRLVALIDADLQYQPEDLLRLRRELMDHSVDVVQGWRSPVGRERDSRYRLSRGFNAILNHAFGMRLQDNKSGFVMCSKPVMEDLLSHQGRYAYFQSFIMVAAHAKGYSYREVETLFESRRAGRSFLEGRALRVAGESVVDVVRATREYRVRRRVPDVSERHLARHGADDPEPSSSAVNKPGWPLYMRGFGLSHWMITRDVERYYESLRKSQWLDSRQLQDLQDDKLQRLLRHAYRNVPYYRHLMQRERLRPENIRGQRDLHKLPLLSKRAVREHLYFDILSANHDKANVLKITTSGSTGEPFLCFADRAQLEFRWAATLRSQEWAGYRFGDPSVRLWHQTIGLSPARAAMERLDAKLARRTFVPVFEMRTQGLAGVARRIAAAEPVLVDGYAEALDLIARFLADHGNPGIAPRGVMSSAQSLPRASRELIEQAFGCPVFDKYGAREFSGIAYECDAHDGHHVVAEGLIVEVLRDGVPAEPGEVGEVVITDLNNYCLPFIRYRVGDLAVAVDPLEKCACGRGLPKIGDVQGRVQSIIVGTDGRFLPGTFFAHFLKEYYHAIERFQVLQEEPGRIRFRVVRAGRFSDDALEEILSGFRRYLGDDMIIDVEYVDELALVKTGKHVATMSSLGIDFQTGAPRLRPH